MPRSTDDQGRSRLARIGLALGLVLSVAVPAATVSARTAPPTGVRSPADVHNTTALWARADRPDPAPGRTVGVHARQFRPLALDTGGLRAVLALAPRERTVAARTSRLPVSLPAPNGTYQLFALQESAIMAPGLARRHPEIKTYRGRGITDPGATIHADLSPLGFHASIRSPSGAWYIDPYFIARNPSLYASYFGRDAKNVHGTFVEREVPAGDFALSRRSIASTGENLRTYRLALITDPGYAAYHLGNTTAAKVALMNRVNQPYEDDLTIRLQLVANNDLLNFDTYAQATAPNGPCGAAACFTLSQVTGCSSTTAPGT